MRNRRALPFILRICQSVPPPLQADLSRQGLAHLRADAPRFDIEGIKRRQRIPAVIGRIGQRYRAVCIAFVDQSAAFGEVGGKALVQGQSTATRAAPTGRPSRSMML